MKLIISFFKHHKCNSEIKDHIRGNRKTPRLKIRMAKHSHFSYCLDRWNLNRAQFHSYTQSSRITQQKMHKILNLAGEVVTPAHVLF